MRPRAFVICILALTLPTAAFCRVPHDGLATIKEKWKALGSNREASALFQDLRDLDDVQLETLVSGDDKFLALACKWVTIERKSKLDSAVKQDLLGEFMACMLGKLGRKPEKQIKWFFQDIGKLHNQPETAVNVLAKIGVDEFVGSESAVFRIGKRNVQVLGPTEDIDGVLRCTDSDGTVIWEQVIWTTLWNPTPVGGGPDSPVWVDIRRSDEDGLYASILNANGLMIVEFAQSTGVKRGSVFFPR